MRGSKPSRTRTRRAVPTASRYRPASATPARNAPSAGSPWLAPAAIAILVAVLAVDVFRIGFFADDFHFLDIAHRVSWASALSGQFGIYPWYRPLSREVYFAVVAAAGGAELVIAHAMSLACVAAVAWQIRGLALRLVDSRVAAIAPALFLTYAMTKFLTAWPSGFQDLLAILLVLLAVRAQLEGRYARAVLWAFLAPFAKESAVLVYPILVLHAVLCGRERGIRPWMLAQAGALVAVVAIHLAIRAAWRTGGTEAHVERSMPALFGSVARVAGGFVSHAPVLEPVPLALAAVAAVAAAVLLSTAAAAAGSASRATGGPSPKPAPGRAVAFLAAAAALGLAPLVVGHTIGLASAYDYYAFSAVPWLAMLLALVIARLPRTPGTLAVAALVAWNVAALGLRTPDLSTPDAWRFRNWDWAEAVRLTAVSRRLSDDVRSTLAARPESLVVLYVNILRGSYFQTEDGPATREALRDPTVRAYWLNAPPFGLRPGSFTILSFNHATRHLERYRLSLAERGGLTATAVASGNAPAAWAFASYGDSAENSSLEFGYYRSASALLAEGVQGARRELAVAGLADTTGPAPERQAASVVGPASPIYAPMVRVLRRPLDAGEHVALADAFRSQGAAVSEAVELRIATTLDSARMPERLRLARTLMALGLEGAAGRDLEHLVAAAPGTLEGAEAHRLLERAARATDVDVSETSIQEFRPRR